MTKAQKTTKLELEKLIEKFKDNPDLITPILTVYTVYLAEINAPIAMAAAAKIRDKKITCSSASK
jgi:hypothetical protein